jgi:prepilin-type N-terminal cleavage/methylation domain-containing protein
MRHTLTKAFTLIEILFVLAILGLLFAIALPQFSKMRDGQILNSTISDITSALNKASSQSLASLDSSVYGVHFSSNKFTIFKGVVFDINSLDNEIYDINSRASISSIVLTGGAHNLYFNRLTNTPSNTGSIVITVGSFSKTITIDQTGKISTN